MTTYPGAIDGYQQIRVVRDTIDELIANDHNSLRSAIIAIEQTLGLNPNGPFGTVRARLDDAYSNIAKHSSGDYPRHVDSHIDSPARSGSTYSLSSGSVATQLTALLTYLNAVVLYGGSSPTALADGYVLPASYITSAITQIIAQLGGITGSTKIGGEATAGSFIDANTPPYNLSEDTLRNQLIELLTYINNYHESTGAANVGIAAFNTTRHTFADAYVQDHIESIAGYVNETNTFLERAFDSFVVDGMTITQSGSNQNAVVAAGYIASDGRILKYSGGTLSLSGPEDTIYYIYAIISGGTVSVAAVESTNISTIINAINHVVLLRKIKVATGITAWKTNIDMRRFGVLSNDKSVLTVGNTPSLGKDGYGCDFLTLKGAIEYIKTVNTTTKMILPRKLILVSDLIAGSTDTGLVLDVDGFEINGNGHTITVSTDAPLFYVNADEIIIQNLIIKPNFSVAPTAACLAMAPATTSPASSISNLKVTNCGTISYGTYAIPFFLRFGSITNAANNCVISNNTAEVRLGGIETHDISRSLRNSIIIGNEFYQLSFAAGYDGISASDSCIVSNNIIRGGFENGIKALLTNTVESGGVSITNNLIIGHSLEASYVMDVGITLHNETVGETFGSLIANNVIRGVNNYGINCLGDLESGGSEKYIVISGNLIDNYIDDVTTPPSTMIGIKGYAAATLITNNQIVAPGQYGIENAYVAVGNQIIGHSLATSLVTAIVLSEIELQACVISDNLIYNCVGHGIDANLVPSSIISNNLMQKLEDSGTAILDAGSFTIISNNSIVKYGTSPLPTIKISGVGVLVVNNSLFDCASDAIDADSQGRCVILNNFFYGNAVTSGRVIYDIEEYSFVSGNYISRYGNVAANSIIQTVTGSGKTSITNNFIASVGTECIAAINLGYDSNYFISGNILYNIRKAGIHINKSSSSTIISNIIMGLNLNVSGDDGIKHIGSKNLVANNAIYNSNYNGITIEDGTTTQSQISGNIIHNPCGNGIFVAQSASQYSICDNQIIIGSFYNANYGIQLYQFNDECVVSNNRILVTSVTYTNIGIYANSATNTVISNNYILDAGSEGIHSLDGVGGQICGNFIKGAGADGIFLELGEFAGNTYMLVANNFIYNSTKNGIYSYGGSYLSIVGNKVRTPGSSYSGIATDQYVTKSSIQSNHVSSYVYYAYALNGADELMFTDNMATNPQTNAGGANFTGSINCLIVGNYIAANGTGTAFNGVSSVAANVAAGNIARGGADPGSWGIGNFIDISNCRYFA